MGQNDVLDPESPLPKVADSKTAAWQAYVGYLSLSNISDPPHIFPFTISYIPIIPNYTTLIARLPRYNDEFPSATCEISWSSWPRAPWSKPPHFASVYMSESGSTSSSRVCESVGMLLVLGQRATSWTREEFLWHRNRRGKSTLMNLEIGIATTAGTHSGRRETPLELWTAPESFVRERSGKLT